MTPSKKKKMVFTLIMLVLGGISLKIQEINKNEPPRHYPYAAADPTAFLSVWDTTKIGISNNNQVQLPLESNGTYAFMVNWGDETEVFITHFDQTEVTHTYASEGVYTINITGT